MQSRNPTKAECKVLETHHLSPKAFTKLQAMKAMRLGYNYNKFHTLYYLFMINHKAQD